MDFRVSCVHTNKTIIVFIFLNNPLSFIPRKVSAKGEPPSLSRMKVMEIRNCVSVRLNATDIGLT